MASTRPPTAILVSALVLSMSVVCAPRARAVEPSELGLQPWALEVLEREGFVVVPGDSPDFGAAYGRLAAAGVPAFVTSDAVLQTTAAVADRTLHALETGDIYARLEELSRELVRLSEEQYLLAVHPVVREAARLNMAYFAVGLSLLDPDYFPPEFVMNLVERELALIEAGTAVAMSPIMGPTPLDDVAGPGEDYSNYAPHGRHADEGRAGRFYRAASWYGRMAFALPEGRVEDYRLTRQALLVVRALESEAGDWLELLDRVHEPLAFFYGDSGDPTPSEYLVVSREVFGEEFDIELVADDDLVAAFVQRVAETAPAHFESHELRGMRFLGRRHYPDTPFLYLLARSDERTLPTSLDVIALLDSRAARSVLEEEEDAFADDVYRHGFEHILNELDALTYDDWTRDLHWSWLYALSALTGGPEDGAPRFATGDAWDAKELSTAAAGWSLLRNTWQPSGLPAGRLGKAELGWGAAEVEPYPRLYERLRELTENLRDRLLESDLLRRGIALDLEGHASMLSALEHRARTTLDEGMSHRAGGGGGDAGAGRSPREPAAEQIPAVLGANLPVAFSATVYRDIASQHALEVTLGAPDMIYVLDSGRDGRVSVCGGAVFSFYEFERAPSSGPADAGGPSAVPAEGTPRPAWVSRFLVE